MLQQTQTPNFPYSYMEISLNYCSQNGGNVYRAPYYNGNPNIGPRIIRNLNQTPHGSAVVASLGASMGYSEKTSITVLQLVNTAPIRCRLRHEAGKVSGECLHVELAGQALLKRDREEVHERALRHVLPKLALQARVRLKRLRRREKLPDKPGTASSPVPHKKAATTLL